MSQRYGSEGALMRCLKLQLCWGLCLVEGDDSACILLPGSFLGCSYPQAKLLPTCSLSGCTMVDVDLAYINPFSP